MCLRYRPLKTSSEVQSRLAALPIQNQSNFYVLVIAFIELQILMGPQSKKDNRVNSKSTITIFPVWKSTITISLIVDMPLEFANYCKCASFYTRRAMGP